MSVFRKGIITHFYSRRGFGFNTVSEGRCYFFHITRFEKGSQPVLEGHVEFKVAPPRSVGKRPIAVLVRYWRPSEEGALAGANKSGSTLLLTRGAK